MSKPTSCAKCGACTTVCPVYQATGRESLTARGRIHLLDHTNEKKRSAAFLEIFAKCLLCGACRDVCPRDIDIPGLIVEARQKSGLLAGKHSLKKTLVEKSLASRIVLSGLSKVVEKTSGLLDLLPKDSGLRLKLAGLDLIRLRPDSPKKSYLEIAQKRKTTDRNSNIIYFTGCLANYLDPEIGLATEQLVEKATNSPPLPPENQVCCGLAAYSAGDLPLARKLAKRNINAFAGNDADRPIITSCGSCYSQLKNYPELLADDREWSQKALAFSKQVVEFSSFFTKLADQGSLTSARTAGQKNPESRQVLYHDPCHLRFNHKITGPPRRLISSTLGLKLTELPHGPQCCGHGGLFNLAHPDLSHKIMNTLTTDFAAAGADVVVSTCTGCLLQWRQTLAAKGDETPVEHLAVLLVEMLKDQY